MKRQLPEPPPAAFAKQDESDDTNFYVPVRLVSHIDDAATQALTALPEPSSLPGVFYWT